MAPSVVCIFIQLDITFFLFFIFKDGFQKKVIQQKQQKKIAHGLLFTIYFGVICVSG